MMLYMGGKTAGMIGLLTVLAEGRRPAVVGYSEDVLKVADGYALTTYRRLSEVKEAVDFLLCVHGREIVPADLTDNDNVVCVNVHPCLWRYKGADPIGRALLAGERMLSVGAHRMTQTVDEGELIEERFVSVPPRISVTAAYTYLYPVYVEVIREVLRWQGAL